MSKPITQKELESYLWDSAVLLRNHIDAGAYKQYIFPLLFFKRLNDVYEEETALAIQENGPEADSWEETHRFVLPKDARWDTVRQTTQDVGAAILRAFRAIEKANPDKLDGIFGDGTWTNKRRLPDRLLKDLLEHFSSQTLSLANCPEDELGRGYEYLIKRPGILHQPHRCAPDGGIVGAPIGRVHLRSHLRQRRHAGLVHRLSQGASQGVA